MARAGECFKIKGPRSPIKFSVGPLLQPSALMIFMAILLDVFTKARDFAKICFESLHCSTEGKFIRICLKHPFESQIKNSMSYWGLI